MYLRELKDPVGNCEIFIAMHSERKDKEFNALKDALWRVKALIEMYQSCGECMAFNIDEKYNNLKNLFWDAVELYQESKI